MKLDRQTIDWKNRKREEKKIRDRETKYDWRKQGNNKYGLEQVEVFYF